MTQQIPEENEENICIPLKEIDPVSGDWVMYNACMSREDAIHWTNQFYSLE